MTRPRIFPVTTGRYTLMPGLSQAGALALLVLVSGCHSRAQTQGASAASGASQTSAPAEKSTPGACELVTQAEMSSILGSPVVAAEHGSNKCIYTAASGISPYVEFSVDLGDGEAAMGATRMMATKEPGIADPYEGVGDEAASVGPALMIRTGEDLVTLVFSGVEDVPDKARRIFDTAKARM